MSNRNWRMSVCVAACVGALSLVACEAPRDDAVTRAARGTRDATKSTVKSIEDAQKQAGDMADQIGKDPSKAIPPTPGTPGTPEKKVPGMPEVPVSPVTPR